MLKKRVIVTTVPFGVIDPKPLRLLEENGIELVINPLDRKLKPEEVADVIRGFPVVIAGTEIISEETMKSCPDLKAICRVGIGLDGVDLPASQELGIQVSYTPDGPSAAVGELTIGLMLNLLRKVSQADRSLRQKGWKRYTGTRLSCLTVGVVGVGRIGSRVIKHLLGGFPGVKILANDLEPTTEFKDHPDISWVSKEEIYQQADIVSLHLPLSAQTCDLIGTKELSGMKPSAVLVNTARGGIVNESELAIALHDNVIAGAAIDVFEQEPYTGSLTDIESALLTCHMGSMTVDCRVRMEIEATEEAIRFLLGETFVSPVPEFEYKIASLLQKTK